MQVTLSACDVSDECYEKLQNEAGLVLIPDYEGVGDIMAGLRQVTFVRNRPKASDEQIKRARDLYETDDIQIDNDAVLSVVEKDRRYWVQAWVYIDERWSEDTHD